MCNGGLKNVWAGHVRRHRDWWQYLLHSIFLPCHAQNKYFYVMFDVSDTICTFCTCAWHDEIIVASRRNNIVRNSENSYQWLIEWCQFVKANLSNVSTWWHLRSMLLQMYNVQVLNVCILRDICLLMMIWCDTRNGDSYYKYRIVLLIVLFYCRCRYNNTIISWSYITWFAFIQLVDQNVSLIMPLRIYLM